MWASPVAPTTRVHVDLNNDQEDAVRKAEAMMHLHDTYNELDLRGIRALAVVGSAGTGKSTVLVTIADQCNAKARRVALCSFTACVAYNYRGVCPCAHCDAVHGVTWYYDGITVHEVAIRLLRYDTVIIDKIFMLPKISFDLVVAAWLDAEKYFLLNVGGDEGQLVPFNDDGQEDVGHYGNYYWRYFFTARLALPARSDAHHCLLQERVRFGEMPRELTEGVWQEGTLDQASVKNVRDLFTMYAATTQYTRA